MTWLRLRRWTGRVLVLALAAWAGYSFGYVAAMNEQAETQGEGRHGAWALPDRDGVFFVRGDAEAVTRIVRYWAEHMAMERGNAP